MPIIPEKHSGKLRYKAARVEGGREREDSRPREGKAETPHAGQRWLAGGGSEAEQYRCTSLAKDRVPVTPGVLALERSSGLLSVTNCY